MIGLVVALVASLLGACVHDGLPSCDEICPMGPRDAWLCTRDPDDGIERCACPANDGEPEACEGDL